MAAYEYKRSTPDENDKFAGRLYRRHMDETGRVELLDGGSWWPYRPESTLDWWTDESRFAQAMLDSFGRPLNNHPVVVTDDDDDEDSDTILGGCRPTATSPTSTIFQGFSVEFPEQQSEPEFVDLDKSAYGHAYERNGNVYYRTKSGILLSDSRNGIEFGSAAGYVDLGPATVTIDGTGTITITPTTGGGPEYVDFRSLGDVKPGDWFKYKGGAVFVVLTHDSRSVYSALIFFSDGSVRGYEGNLASNTPVRRLGNSPLRINVPTVK